MTSMTKLFMHYRQQSISRTHQGRSLTYPRLVVLRFVLQAPDLGLQLLHGRVNCATCTCAAFIARSPACVKQCNASNRCSRPPSKLVLYAPASMQD